MEKIKPLTDPDQITGHLRLKDLYARQRRDNGPGSTSTEDLLTEGDILLRLLATEQLVRINLAGEMVRRSIESKMGSEGEQASGL